MSLHLITAAAGNTGYPTALELLRKGEQVRALVRRTSPRSEELRARGAEVVLGSMDDIDDVRSALGGVQRAYFCPPLLPGLLDKAAIFAEAAHDADLEYFVAMSQWLAEPAHPSIHTRHTWLADTLLRRTGIDATLINPGWFADNYLAGPDLITQFGMLPLPLGSGLNAPPSNEDIGAVVSTLLIDPTGHEGLTLRPTGPAVLSPEEIAEALGRVVGNRVRYVDIPIGTFRWVSRSLGMPDYTAAQVVHYFADYQLNSFGHGAPTTVVADLTGRPAEDFETVARRYLTSAATRRTSGTRLRALGRMTRGMLRGPADLGTVARVRDFEISHRRLAADSDRWLATHADPAQAVGALG
ncbi:NmrA family NAD(P)-binding protein [Agromyces bauzanensis]